MTAFWFRHGCLDSITLQVGGRTSNSRQGCFLSLDFLLGQAVTYTRSPSSVELSRQVTRRPFRCPTVRQPEATFKVKTGNMAITSNDILQHLPLVVYLLAVTGLATSLFPSPRNKLSTLFVLCAVGSLGMTWTYMFRYMFQSYRDHKAAAGLFSSYSTTHWLEETSLFDEAWRYVCRTAERWWISSQLCLFTVGVFTVFLYAEGV